MMDLILSLGSNCGDRERNIKSALTWLSRVLNDIKSSDIYESPCAKDSGKSYMNAVVSCSTEMSLHQLDSLIKNYEIEAGRDEECRKIGSVPIDIDIVVVNGEVLKEWDFKQKFFVRGLNYLNSNL